MNRLFIIQSLKKHLWKKNSFYVIFFAAAFFMGCGKEPGRKDYVARVNDSFLTKSDLDKMADSSSGNNFYRSELIRNWIDKELLYQQAVNEGIIEEEDFERIINESRRELAGAILLKQVSDQYTFDYTSSDLEEFFNLNSDEFRLTDDSYLLNIAEFNEEEEAINFRNSVLQDDWQKIIGSVKYSGDVKREDNVLLNSNEIYPPSLRTIIRELNPLEVSLIINTDSTDYKIIQVLEKYPVGTIPPFGIIKEKIEKRFLSLEKRKFIEEYIKKLYAENDIEVKDQDK